MMLFPLVLVGPTLLVNSLPMAMLIVLVLTFLLANALPLLALVLPRVPGWPRRHVLFVYGTLKR